MWQYLFSHKEENTPFQSDSDQYIYKISQPNNYSL